MVITAFRLVVIDLIELPGGCFSVAWRAVTALKLKRTDLSELMITGTQRMGGVAVLLGLLPVFLLCYVSGALADGNVTIETITIFKTHEWIGKPTIYFRCRDEEKKYFADVVDKNRDYEFKGQESFQPLTTLHGEKCKRCGVYEQDTVKGDDTFYEAELCPDDFAKSPVGRLFLYKEKELNASLLCPDCVPRSPGSADTQGQTAPDLEEDEDDKGAGIAFIIIILVLIILFVLGSVAYSKWRQKQRREQQARFVKMFEDDDDLDAEFGLKDDL